MKNLFYSIGGSVMLLLMYSCQDDEIAPANLNLVKQTSIHSSQLGLTFDIMTDGDDLITGYNNIYIMVEGNSSGLDLSKLSLELATDMTMTTDMGTMHHGSPVEKPVLNEQEKYFKGAIVFVMPSTAGEWKIILSASMERTSLMEELEMPIEVIMPNEPKLLSFMAGDDKYFISIVEPVSPVVGVNDFELTVHKKASMFSWPAIDDFTIEVEPEMPTMGHGSPNNVNPVHMENGHYVGKVNFTMDGYWRLNLLIKQGEDLLKEDIGFDMTFTSISTQ